jgi:hypothetical protein
VVLSMVLLAGAGLLLSTFWRLAWLDPGFKADRVLLTTIDLRGNGYLPERRAAVFRQILESLRALPDVHAASLSDFTPMLPARRIREVAIEGYANQSREDSQVYFNAVSDGYFTTMGTPLLAGRDFNRQDTASSPAVAIVNQTMVKKYFRGANPVGRQFRSRTGDALGDPIEIVGVVKDAKYNDLRQEIPPTAYTAWSQAQYLFPFTNIEVRPAGGAPSGLIAEVKGAIVSVDGSASIEFTTLADQVGRTLQREQLLATLAGFFGGASIAAGSHRAVRRDVLQRGGSAERNRHSHGARRGEISGIADGAGGSGRLDWMRYSSGPRRHSDGNTPGGELRLRSTTERSADAAVCGGGAGRSGRGGGLLAGAPGVRAGSNDVLARRIREQPRSAN